MEGRRTMTTFESESNRPENYSVRNVSTLKFTGAAYRSCDGLDRGMPLVVAAKLGGFDAEILATVYELWQGREKKVGR